MFEVPVYLTNYTLFSAFIYAFSDFFTSPHAPEEIRSAYLDFRDTIERCIPSCSSLGDISEYCFIAPPSDVPLHGYYSDDGNGNWSVVIRNYE